DHFARPDDELTVAQKNKTLQRNFQGYSTRGNADIYSFGISSISQVENAYWQNYKDLNQYRDALSHSRLPIERGFTLTPEDVIRRTTIMRLMCDLSLNFAAISKQTGINFADHFAAELQSLSDLEADGLLETTPCVLMPICRWRQKGDFPAQYEIGRNYRRRNHRIDRCLSTSEVSNPGDAVRSGLPCGRPHPDHPAK